MNELKTFVMPSRLAQSEYTWDTGWGNGYVLLPPGHPCHGMEYDSIHDKFEIDVNGGLTFSESANSLGDDWPITDEFKDYWVVGFDTAHYNDSLTRWPKHAVEAEAERLAEQLKNLQPVNHGTEI